jgi:WD40 repeat protein
MLESGVESSEPIEESENLSTKPPTSSRHIADYELIEEIGRGGMGVVFKARQVRLSRLVALKLILAGPLASGSFIRRFRTEAEAAAKLDHPNIISIYEIGDDEGQHYFAMKLVEGSNLAALIHSKSSRNSSESFPGRREFVGQPSWAATLMLKVARAVHYAHERGVLHRDLKPANILIDQREEPFVTDFGLAKILEQDSSLTGSQAVMGTPAYMAPEQAAGKTREATTAADIYSLGVVLYELLTGSQPFSGETPLELMRQAAEAEPSRPRALNPKVDRDLETICLKCLEKDPSARYGSAEALADDLERWLRNEPISVRPAGALKQLGKWVRRKPIVAGLAGSVAAVLVLGFAGVTWQWRRAEQRGVDLALNVYAAEMQLALQSWEEGNTANALRLLEKHRAAPWRGFEWRYLLQQSRNGMTALRTDGDFVSEVAFSPDGKWLVAAEHTRRQQGKHSIAVWDTTSLERVTAFPLPSKPREVWWIGGFTFLDDGRTLAADCNDGIVRRWDLASGKEELLLADKTRGCWPPRLSPDGKWLVAAFKTSQRRYYDLRAFETSSGAEVGSPVSVPLAGGSMNDHKIRWAPDSKRFAVASRPNVVRIFSLPPLAEVAALPVIAQPEVVAFSSTSGLLAVGGFDQAIQVWEMETGKLLKTLRGKLKAPSHDLCFSPDETLLASSTVDSAITLWDLRSGVERAAFQGHVQRPNSLAFSANGEVLASGGHEDGMVKIWQIPSTKASTLQAPRTNDLRQVTFSPDGRLLAVTAVDATVQLFDTATEELLATLRPASNITDVSLSWEVRDLPLDFSRDGSLLAVGNGNHTVSIWDVTRRRETHVLTNNASFVHVVAFAPDGKTLLTASQDKTLRLWDVASGKVRSTITATRPLRFAARFSPDGNLLAYSGSLGVLTLWHVKQQHAQRSWNAHPAEVYAVAFSHDGHTLATSSDQMIKLWDVRSGSTLAEFTDVHGPAFSLIFTPDGRNLIAAEATGHVRSWHLPSLREAGVLRAPMFLVSAALSPEGTLLATCSLEGGVRLFRAAPCEAAVPAQGR